MTRVSILGTGIDEISKAGAVDFAYQCFEHRRGAYVVTPNTEIVLAARKNRALRAALDAAALSLPDGAGVLIASRILKTPIAERIAGIDFAEALLARMEKQGKSVFLLGAKPGVAERAAEALRESCPGLVIAGTEDGFRGMNDEAALIGRINARSPDLLLVCLGSPKQELWMHRNAPRLKVGLMAGLGGALDVFAGDVKRSPEILRKCGLEWLYRLLLQPRRIGRCLALPLIVPAAIAERIRRKRENYGKRKTDRIRGN